MKPSARGRYKVQRPGLVSGVAGAVEQNKRLENAQKFTRMNRKRKPERIYSETKIINGGKFNIVKCAEFRVEMTLRKVRDKLGLSWAKLSSSLPSYARWANCFHLDCLPCKNCQYSHIRH